MSAAGDLSAAAQHRTTTMLINLGSRVPFTDSFPVMPSDQKTVALHSTLLVLLGERVAVEALLLVMAPFRTEAVLTVLHRNDPP